MYRILLVEDDFALAEAMKRQLENDGNEVIPAEDFRRITETFAEIRPQLVLMDLRLPYKDGYYWCREIRRISSVPVVFVSSASDNMSIVMAVNMGGDDFIPKPVDPMVLVAKVQAILRRTYELTSDGQILSFAGAMLRVADGTVCLGDVSVELTRNELKILEILLENKGKTVSREALMMRLWQDDLYVEENTLTVNVGRLRRKLESVGLAGVIRTRPGEGYLLS